MPSRQAASSLIQYVPLSLSEAEPQQQQQPPSLAFLIALNSFAFAYCLVVSTLGIVILPTEATLLYADRHPVMLGFMLACTGVTQLISPVVGYISDRNTSQWGRRRGLMVGGTVAACAGSFGMWYSREHQLGPAYICSLTLCVFGVNVVYSCYTALLPDFVPTTHMGRASGVMAAMSMLGSFCGFGLFGFYLGVVHSYALYVVVLTLTVLLTCVVCHESPLLEAAPLRCAEMIAAYTIDATGSPDFFWVFVTRTFYYMGISLQAFSLFMLRDVQKVDDPKYYTSIIAMVGQISAAIVAVPAGRLSDQLGRKPLVYAACALMALVYVGFAFEPSVSGLIGLGVAYGIGNGMFLSVDYALACDVLPSFDNAAQSLGVWGVSAFLGSTLGPLAAGPLLTYFGRTDSPDHYSSFGYIIVMATGAIYVTFAAVLLRNVKEALREKKEREGLPHAAATERHSTKR